jgi:thiol:disulfide interchange protein DsbA
MPRAETQRKNSMSTFHRAPTLALCLLAAVSWLHPAPAAAQQEGTTFRTLTPPQPTDSPGKIEVVEFFSYACPHCNEFHPLLTAWLAKQPKDVVLRRVPVGFNRPAWINLQRAFYTLQTTGDLDRLDGALFNAIHVKHEQLFDEQSLADWVAKNGGNGEKFAAYYVSFGVNNQTFQADKMAEDYGVEAVPTMAVDGRYVVLGQSFADILANTDQLITKVRAERAAAKPAPKGSAQPR